MTIKTHPYGDYSDGEANDADELLDDLNGASNAEKRAIRLILDQLVALLGGEAKTGGFPDADKMPVELLAQFKGEVDYLKGTSQLS